MNAVHTILEYLFKSFLILYSSLRLGLQSGFQTEVSMHFSFMRATRPSKSTHLDINMPVIFSEQHTWNSSGLNCGRRLLIQYSYSLIRGDRPIAFTPRTIWNCARPLKEVECIVDRKKKHSKPSTWYWETRIYSTHRWQHCLTSFVERLIMKSPCYMKLLQNTGNFSFAFPAILCYNKPYNRVMTQ